MPTRWNRDCPDQAEIRLRLDEELGILCQGGPALLSSRLQDKWHFPRRDGAVRAGRLTTMDDIGATLAAFQELARQRGYGVAWSHSTSAVMGAEKVLKQGGLTGKFIPTSCEFSSDCGDAVRFEV